jgi:hypothetical protein
LENLYGSTPPLKNLRTVSSPLWQVGFYFYHHLSLISPQIFLFYPQVAVIFLKLESYIVTSILETSISGIWKHCCAPTVGNEGFLAGLEQASVSHSDKNLAPDPAIPNVAAMPREPYDASISSNAP